MGVPLSSCILYYIMFHVLAQSILGLMCICMSVNYSAVPQASVVSQMSIDVWLLVYGVVCIVNTFLLCGAVGNMLFFQYLAAFFYKFMAAITQPFLACWSVYGLVLVSRDPAGVSPELSYTLTTYIASIFYLAHVVIATTMAIVYNSIMDTAENSESVHDVSDLTYIMSTALLEKITCHSDHSGHSPMMQ
jgi:hypothetical protein